MQADKVTGFRLSPQQRLGWQLATQTGARSGVRGTVVIEGVVDPDRLHDCIRTVAARYEILRTRFTERSGVPLQVITDRSDFLWSRNGPDELARSIQLQDGPVFAAQLIAESPERHRLTLHIATACADCVSLELLFREIAAAYAGIKRADVPLQYADLSAWLNEMVSAAGEGAEFWRKTLEAVEDNVCLPTERAPRGETSPRFQVARRVCAEGASAARRIARDAAVEPAAVLLSCWQQVLSRLTGAKRLLVGVTLPGRSYPGTDAAIGPLERQVPVIHETGEIRTIASLLKSTQSALTEVAAWQEYFSWEEAARWGPRSARFGFAHHEIASAWAAGPLHWQVESLDCIVQPNTAMLWCTSSPRGLVCELSYDQSRLSEAAAQCLLRQFETVLLGLARVPASTAVTDLSLVGEEERDLLASFNQTALPDDPGRTALAMFQDQVLRTPNNVAICIGRQEITYAELDARANRLAHQLIASGAGAEDVIGVCLDRGLSLIVSFLAIWKAGAAYLPVHQLPEARARYIVKDSGARLVITDFTYASQLKNAGINVLDVESPEIQAQSSARPEWRAVPGNLAYVMYTSGSTGEPKGVLVEHRSLANYLRWVLSTYGLGERERTLMKTSIGFDASLREWLMPLLQGGALILLEEGLQRDPQSLIRELRDRRATTLHVVPTLLRVLVEEPTLAECTDLVRVFAGGEILDSALVGRFHERTGKTLINMYGPTETTVSATSQVMRSHEECAIGRPVANTQVHVLRPDLSPAGIGETGEICIAGSAVARGYAGRADDTAVKYAPDPYGAPGTRLYRTGDRGRYGADGVLQFLGRNDAQVKVRGYRVELTEIERALQAQPGVVHAAVLLKERAADDRQLVAYVELSPAGPRTSVNEISAGVRELLPAYMCPSQYVELASFPRTRSGKLDRVALAEIQTDTAGHGAVAPRSEVEARLAGIWSAVLGIEKIGVTENFFEIGGDSIIAIQIVARARQAGLSLTPLQLFQYQTVEELAKVAETRAAVVRSAGIASAGPFPLTPIQQAFFEHSTDNVNHFNQGLVLEIPASVQLPLLEKALSAVYEHHDALHLRFEKTPSGWRQYYAQVRPEILHRDASDVPDARQALQQIISRENASLNIAEGPLTRIVIVQLGAGQGRRLLMVAHHLVIDTVSWRILLEDLSECYAQLARGETPRSPVRTTSYRDWSEGLREHVKSQELQEELAYWRTVQEQAVDCLFADNRAGANTAAHERQFVVRLEESETRRLLSDAAKPYKTHLMELFLSALCEAMYRWRGHQAIRLALEGHGREAILPDVDLTKTVGWFTSLFPLVLERRDEENLAERIKRLKEQLRAVPRKGVGYGLLRYLGADSGLGGKASLVVNYLGQLDGAIGRDALLPSAPEGGADSVSPGRERPGDLTLNAMILNGCLHMCWSYSAVRYREQTITELAQHLEQSLREVIAHCCSAQAGGFTLSDVREFGWGAAQLDALAGAISRAEKQHASR